MATSRPTSTEDIPSRKGRARRAALLDALSALLSEGPLAEVDIDAIARRAGVGRSAFYFYFPTKAAAVAALFEQTSAQLLAVGEDWYERDDLQPAQRVRDGLASTIAFWREHARLLRAMSDAGGEAAERWAAVQADFGARAAARIRADRERGLIAEDLDPDITATVLVGMVVEAMRADVRAIVDTGAPLDGIEDALVRAWGRTLYGA